MKPFPWQQQEWKQLQQLVATQRLPHGILIHGPEGLGKAGLATAFCAGILCQQIQPDGMCGQCTSCKQFLADSHPDLKLIQPAESGKTIPVDQIREVTHFLTLTPHYAGRKVVLILDADQMNVNASNSLLKSLEEPPESALLVLVSSRPSALPATIRSRCQQLALPVPANEVALRWLKIQVADQDSAALLLALANGAPLKAKSFSEQGVMAHREALLDDLEQLSGQKPDIVGIAARWLKQGIPMTLYWLNSWAADIARLKSAEKPPSIANPDQVTRLKKLSQHVSLNAILDINTRIVRAKQELKGNMNAQLLAEDIALEWRQKVVQHRRNR